MAEELKTLTEELDKDQPLTGDSLALLQGAQARRQRIATALRSRGYYDARITATVDLRGLPKGRFKVKIAATLTTGKVVTSTRRYRTCTKKGARS